MNIFFLYHFLYLSLFIAFYVTKKKKKKIIGPLWNYETRCGQQMGHFLLCLWDSLFFFFFFFQIPFFFFNSIWPILSENDKKTWSQVQQVCSALICHHTLHWGGSGSHESMRVQNPSNNPFPGILLWNRCLTFIHFENGHVVTVYFMLGSIETHMLDEVSLRKII